MLKRLQSLLQLALNLTSDSSSESDSHLEANVQEQQMEATLIHTAGTMVDEDIRLESKRKAAAFGIWYILSIIGGTTSSMLQGTM